MMRMSGLKWARKIESLPTPILPTSSLKSLLSLRLLLVDCNPQYMELCSPCGNGFLPAARWDHLASFSKTRNQSQIEAPTGFKQITTVTGLLPPIHAHSHLLLSKIQNQGSCWYYYLLGTLEVWRETGYLCNFKIPPHKGLINSRGKLVNLQWHLAVSTVTSDQGEHPH